MARQIRKANIYSEYIERKGWCLVLIHGAGGNLRAWDKVKDELIKRSYYSILTLDLRGQGKSVRPDKLDKYSLELSATDVEKVINNHHIKDYVLIGHCLGGMVITKLLEENQQAKLAILIASRVKAPTLLKLIFKIIGKKIIENKLKKSQSRPENYDYSYGNYWQTGDWNLNRLHKDIQTTGLGQWLATYWAISNFDGQTGLINYRKPVLIIHGQRDTVCGVGNAKKMAKFCPQAIVKIVPTANHIPLLNQPTIVANYILQFTNNYVRRDKKHMV